MYVLYYVFHRFDIEYLVFDLCHCLITSQAISNVQFKIACVYPDPHNYEGFLLLITDVLCENDGSVLLLFWLLFWLLFGGAVQSSSIDRERKGECPS